MKARRGLFFAAAVSAWLAGCGTTASLHMLQPIDEPLSRYTRAIVTVASSPEVSWRDGVKYAEERLKFALLDKLRAAKKFNDVTGDAGARAADSDLKIALTLAGLGASGSSGGWGPSVGIGVGGGGGGGFFGLGMGAPLGGGGSSSKMIVQVELLEAKSGRRIGYLDATATSGELAAQAQAIADKIVMEIAAK